MPPVKDEQQRNLRIVWGVVAVLILAFLVAGGVLYFGGEVPPRDLSAGPTSASGYRPPPGPVVLPDGVVARGSLPPAGAGVQAAIGDTALGKRAYDVSCGMCHGEPGRGPGPVGEAYLPPPPDLAARVSTIPPARLYASITEGIRSTPTREAARYLPREWHAFHETTTAAERWAIVGYLRGLYSQR